MNHKSKNKTRNTSHSRESRSNLASNSKQKITIGKYKSEKNLFFKNKNLSQNLHSKSKQNSKNSSRSGYQNFPQSRPQQIAKPQLPSEQYYNHAKKAKSKSKHHEQNHEEIQRQKKSYFESLYMHKEDQQHGPDVIQNSFQRPHFDKGNSPLNSNLKMIKKIRIIEKHAAIDVNGKFVQKQAKKTQRKGDSQQHTFSLFQNTKNSIAANTHLQNKKMGQNLKMKKDKNKVKTKNSQLYEAQMITQNKSAMKSVLKLKKHTSSGKEPRDIKQIRELKEDLNFTRNSQATTELQKFRSTREGTRRHNQRQTIQKSSTKTIQSAETEASPQFMMKQNFMSSLSTALVSYDEVIKEVEEEKQNLKILRANITNNEYLQERINCIDFIGKICHLMSIKREAHSLAVIFLDNYVENIISSIMKDKEKRKLFKINQEAINFPELIKNLKLFAISCLLLALKMDDGLMARKLCFQLNTNLDGLLKSSQSKISQKMKESIAHLNGFTSNSTSSNKHPRKESVYSLSKSKTNISSMSSIKTIQEKESRKAGKKEQNVWNIDMGSIIKIENDILLRFKFRLSVKSPQYWVDMLTFLWDDYINAQVSWEEMLYFREQESTANMSHLLQLSEKSYLNLDVHQFPTSTIVLATMYLIIRIKLEEQKECESIKTLYEKYRQNLLKSTNIIFYDNIGINELYGDFLTQLNLSLSDIVGAVKFVGQFLVYENLKTFSFNNKSKQVNNRYQLHQHRLSLYQYNAQIYSNHLK